MGKSNGRVVITGLGIVCPVGSSTAEAWRSIVGGRSGVGSITRFDASGFETTFAGEVRDFDPAAVVGKKEARRMDRFIQLAVAATKEAVEHARLRIGPENGERVGVIIGNGMGGMETIEQGAETLATQGPRRISPFFMPMMLANMASGDVAIATGARGPNMATVSACASSAHAIGEATEIILRGAADVMIAGGAEAPVTKLSLAGFNAMGALSTRNDDPAGASRPFDADRDGFVVGEGAATLILESYEHAVRRGATALGEVTGYATTDDANHVVQPAPGGDGVARAMRRALADAGLDANEIDYVNAHGTSTQLNEKFETQAIKAVFGDAAYRVPISSTKSMTGHLLGAAGALEAALCVLAIGDGCIPPTINYQTPDPDCDLDYVPNAARSGRLRHVLTNSMGFGGHNVALVISAVS